MCYVNPISSRTLQTNTPSIRFPTIQLQQLPQCEDQDLPEGEIIPNHQKNQQDQRDQQPEASFVVDQGKYSPGVSVAAAIAVLPSASSTTQVLPQYRAGQTMHTVVPGAAAAATAANNTTPPSSTGGFISQLCSSYYCPTTSLSTTPHTTNIAAAARYF